MRHLIVFERFTCMFLKKMFFLIWLFFKLSFMILKQTFISFNDLMSSSLGYFVSLALS